MAYQAAIAIDEKIIPFLSTDTPVVLTIDVLSKTGVLNVKPKEGITPAMLAAVGGVSIQVQASLAENQVVPDTQQTGIPEDMDGSPMQPALPHVERDYDEVRDKIGIDLGKPVQTLFSPVADLTGQLPQIAQTVPQESQPLPHVQAQMQPQAQQPANQNNTQLQQMQMQMQMMMQQMQQMQGGQTGNVPQMQQMPQGQATNSQPQPQQQLQLIPSIMSAEELAKAINSSDDVPDIDTSKRLTRQEAQVLERFRLSKPCYVISTVGQLIVDDIEIVVRPSTPSNLASVPLFKLKNSADLHRALASGWLKFVDNVNAQRMFEQANIESGFDAPSSGTSAFSGPNALLQAEREDFDATPFGSGSRDGGGGGVRRQSGTRTEHGVIIAGDWPQGSTMVQDIDEIDESTPDEQSQLANLVNLSGTQNAPNQAGGHMMEPPSAAAVASQQMNSNTPQSRTWKPSTRMD